MNTLTKLKPTPNLPTTETSTRMAPARYTGRPSLTMGFAAVVRAVDREPPGSRNRGEGKAFSQTRLLLLLILLALHAEMRGDQNAGISSENWRTHLELNQKPSDP